MNDTVTELGGPWLTVFIDAIREARGPRAETVARVCDLRTTLMAERDQALAGLAPDAPGHDRLARAYDLAIRAETVLAEAYDEFLPDPED